MGKITHFFNSKNDNSKLIYRVLIAVIALVIFYGILFIIGYISLSRGISFWLINQYFVVSLIGATPIVFKQYCFGSIFFVGAIIGWGVACYVAFLQGPHPTMAGAFYNMAILFISFLIGLIIQFRHNIRKANPNLFKKNK